MRWDVRSGVTPSKRPNVHSIHQASTVIIGCGSRKIININSLAVTYKKSRVFGQLVGVRPLAANYTECV